jgi:hypothetical protein
LPESAPLPLNYSATRQPWGVDNAVDAVAICVKGREDSKDEPGAADFYYGEMEMRRHSTGTPPSRRPIVSIIWLYWLVSGYGLRASRALIALGSRSRSAPSASTCSVSTRASTPTTGPGIRRRAQRQPATRTRHREPHRRRPRNPDDSAARRASIFRPGAPGAARPRTRTTSACSRARVPSARRRCHYCATSACGRKLTPWSCCHLTRCGAA